MDHDLSMKTKIQIRNINPHIVCSLCAGYFIDATTVVECLHTFCKSCIVKYLQTSVYCPTCSIKIHETQPLLQIRLDRTLQEIVFKLIPGLKEAEESRRKVFHEFKGIKGSAKSKDNQAEEEVGYSYDNYVNSYRDDEQITLQLQRHCDSSEPENLQSPVLAREYFRCSLRARVGQLRKVLRKAMELPHYLELELYCNNLPLPDFGNMKFVWVAAWKRQAQPMVISYAVRKQVSDMDVDVVT